jgi:hypothetical protein
MQALLNIVGIFGGCIALVILMYILSQVQMRGWLKEVDKFLNKKQ